MGVPTVAEIVKQNGGHLSVASQPGHGTIFKKTFPRAEETAPSIYLSEQRRNSRPGTETILHTSPRLLPCIMLAMRLPVR
jgi:hypothetical protein